MAYTSTESRNETVLKALSIHMRHEYYLPNTFDPHHFQYMYFMASAKCVLWHFEVWQPVIVDSA